MARGARGSGQGRATPAVLGALTLALVGLGCSSLRPGRPEPVPLDASAHLHRARIALRSDGAEAREPAREAALAALAAAPDWVAPQRLLDDLMVADLLAVQALAARREGLERRPQDAGAWYLAGRMEGRDGGGRFERAVSLDPGLAWGHHGLAWVAALEGDWDAATRHELRALKRARDGWERTFFTQALARFTMADDRADEALQILLLRLEDPWLTDLERVELELQAVDVEIGFAFGGKGSRGYERGLALLRRDDLTDGEVRGLVQQMRAYRALYDPDAIELQLALAARASAVRDALRAELLLEIRPTPLALGLLRRSSGTERVETSAPLLRAARFAGGEFAAAVEEWVAGLPSQVVDAAGLPRAPELRVVLERARALGPAPSAQDLGRFGEALVEAGWFSEARSVAAEVARMDLERALALDERAVSGLQVLQGVERLLQSVGQRGTALEVLQIGEPLDGDPDGEGEAGERGSVRTLKTLLARIDQLADRSPLLAGSQPAKVVESPLLDYGFIGALVHPGPRFSRDDERQGRGRRGEHVPGLARLFDGIGRFGLFGAMGGGDGPDGTVLRRVLVEERAGEHLGARWSGTIAWCEGVDVQSRLTQRGATISGAALHEGYWIDLDVIRRQARSWAEFERRFSGPANRERVERALATPGLQLQAAPAARDPRRRERRSVEPLLGSADRLRLAVLADRGGLPWGDPWTSQRGPLVSFDELVEVTAIHEEGHLCDRRRFLPIGRHMLRAMGLLFRSGFSSASVMQRLEYRAQLVALCSAPDPRVPLVEVLRSAESLGGARTPHPRAYHDLLRDLLAVLDGDLRRHPERWPELDPDRMLVHQLHRIEREKLRSLTVELARREGLVAE